MKLTNIAIATLSIFSASVFAAAPNTVNQTAGTEIHWSAKVPVEFHDEGVILTSQNGTPLTEALKGGDIYFNKDANGTYDGTFTSSNIPLELHYRTCLLSDGVTTDGTGSTDCLTDGGTFVDGEGADAIGDLITNSTWELSSANFNIGGREDAELSQTGQIEMNGSQIVQGTSTVVEDGKPIFTTSNATPATTAPSAGTRYTVNAAIIASNGI